MKNQLVFFTAVGCLPAVALAEGTLAECEDGIDVDGVLFDSLTLNTTTSFGTEVSIVGDCDSSVDLASPELVGANFQ